MSDLETTFVLLIMSSSALSHAYIHTLVMLVLSVGDPTYYTTAL